MKIICREANCPDEAKAFILKCEAEFDKKLRDAASLLIERRSKVITLSGPTCSGKTTTATLLVEELEREGYNAVVMSIDDFYLDNLRHGTAEGEMPDFDTVKSIDLEYLGHYVENLLLGRMVMKPNFNFTTGIRSGYSEYLPSDNDIYIFEGIQAVYPEVTELFGDRYSSVFICVKDDVIVNGIRFTNNEIRLLRRMVRDNNFRNATPEFTLHCWESVRDNEEKNIFPNAHNPDVFIDSFLPYELFVIASYAIPLLRSVSCENENYKVADDLAGRLKNVEDSLYSPSFIPKESMFREFIGN